MQTYTHNSRANRTIRLVNSECRRIINFKSDTPLRLEPSIVI